MPDAIERAAEEDNKHVIQSPTVSEKVNSDLESVKEPEPELGFIHPHKWSTWKKWSNILAVSYCDFLTFAVSMMLAPTIPQVLETFGGARALGSFSVTVYILGFCFGPLLLGPLSDVYGRTLLLRICITLFLILTAACALSTSLAMLIAFRFFAGIFGGAPMAIGGAVISDLYPSGSLGRPMAAYSFGTMMGPTIGPVLGSVINGSLGWRWVFWFASILAGACAVGLFLVLQETHLPTLKYLHTTLANGKRPTLLRSFLFRGVNRDVSVSKRLSIAIQLPARLAFRHPPVALILAFMVVFNGMVNMILSSLGSVYQNNYDFPPTTAGLAYLAIGLGGVLALWTANKIAARFSRRQAGSDSAKRPEHTLPVLLLTGPLFSIGLIWYGWSCQEHAFWFVPLPGLSLFGYGYMSTRLCTQLFLVEAVPGFSGAALAAHTVASSIGGAVVPLSTWPLYSHVGYGWGNTVIALTNLVIYMIPLGMFILAKRKNVSWKVVIE